MSKRNIVITGANRGLGISIVRQLVSEKYYVICLVRSESDELREIFSDQGKGTCVRFDAEDLDQIPHLAKKIIDEHGVIYGLINNAATGKDGVLATQHNKDIRSLLTTNIEAPIILTKYFSRSMLKNRAGGRIINISSIIARSGFNGLAVYGATKAALEGFSKSLARELGKAKITVNCVAPGFMETDMTSGLSSDHLGSIKRRAPLGFATPEDVASSVSYLLSDQASKITGISLTVDGGSTS